jgi:phage terminase Nu1 subunit (DNA packaging protein)
MKPDIPLISRKDKDKKRSAPTGVDVMHALLQRLADLEARVAELERCKHDGHTIEAPVLADIARIVKNDIASVLCPPMVSEAVEAQPPVVEAREADPEEN